MNASTKAGGVFVKLFRKEKPAPAAPAWPPEQYEPVIRSSICTGEQVACMRERETGKLHEVMLLRTAADREEFCRLAGISDPSSLKIVY
jgi:hypothetical protein